MPATPPVGFQDRVREGQQLLELVHDDTVGMVVIVGDAGIGKTAMIAALRDRLDEQPDSVIRGLVYLSGHGYRRITPAILLDDLCRTLPAKRAADIRPRLQDVRPWLDKLDLVLAELGGDGVVLVIDDFDILAPRNGEPTDRELGELLRAVVRDHSQHGLRLVLAGTRRPERLLRDRGGAVRLLAVDEGLQGDDAISFLTSLDPGRETAVQTASPAELGRIVALTGGNPRALELAYGIIRAEPETPLADLLRRLDRPGRPTAILFDLAFARLDRVERRVVEALAIYGRPVPPAAVNYLLHDAVPGLDGHSILEGLYSQRLVRRDRDRYYLPPDPDAAAVLRRMTEGTATDRRARPVAYTLTGLRTRAADYFGFETYQRVERAEDLSPQLSEIELRMLGGDLGMAYAQMTDLDDRYLSDWGQSDALIPWREQLRGKLIRPDAEARNLSYLAAALQQQEAEPGPIVKALTSALDQLGADTDPRHRAQIRLQLAGAHFDIDRLGKAAKLYQLLIDECHAADLADLETEARITLGVCRGRTGKLRAALRDFADVAGLTDDLSAKALRRLNAGWALTQLGETDEALETIEVALEHARHLDNALLQGRCRNALAAALLDDGKPADAADHARAAVSIGVHARNAPLIRDANVSAALAFLAIGNLEDAFAAAAEGARHHRSPKALGALALLGVVAHRLGRDVEAAAAFRAAAFKAAERIRNAPTDYLLREAHALALSGLALANRTYDFASAEEAYRKARSRTKAAGAVKRCLLLLDMLAVGAEREILRPVRAAADA